MQANNELTHIANGNCALSSSEEEEQKWTLGVGQPTKKWVPAQIPHGEEESLEVVNVWLKHHNMALNGAARNDGTSYNIKMQWDEINEIKDEEYTRLSIHDNVIFIREGGEKNGEELVAFFTSTSPKQPVLPHSLVFFLGEVVELTIPLEIVTFFLEVQGTYIQDRFIRIEDLHEEFTGMHHKCTKELRIQ